MARFTSASKTVQLAAGSTSDLAISLQADTFGRVPPRDVASDQNIVWILRGQRATQPVLRYIEKSEGSAVDSDDEYTGFLQLYTKSVETAAGITDGVGSQFSVTRPVTADARITLRGRFSELPTEANAFEAALELGSSDGGKSQIGVSLRQSPFGGAAQALEVSREVRLQYGGLTQWSKRLGIEYGAQLGSIEAYNSRNYVRPRFAVAWTPTPRTKVKVGVTSQTPAIYDAMGGKNGLEGSAYEPFSPGRRFHGEIVLARLSENTTVSVTVFGDRAEAQSLYAGARGERKLLVIDGRSMSTNGTRVELNHDFQDFSAGISYTNASGIGVSSRARSFEDLIAQLRMQRFHTITTRFHANLPLTSTQLTAIYQWMPKVSAVPIDPYQTFSESNEPTLSIIVAQDLPTLRPFGGRVQAIVDARNLLEPSLSGRGVQLAQSPRLVKGGLNIQF
jgi:hypothetical protein